MKCQPGCICKRHTAHRQFAGETQKYVFIFYTRGLHKRRGAPAEIARMLGVTRQRIYQIIQKFDNAYHV